MNWDSYGDTAGDGDLYKDDDGDEDKHEYVDWNDVGCGDSDEDANAHGEDEVEKVADGDIYWNECDVGEVYGNYMEIEVGIEVVIVVGIEVEIEVLMLN